MLSLFTVKFDGKHLIFSMEISTFTSVLLIPKELVGGIKTAERACN